ncbi:MAG: DNA repair protein RadA [Limibaculum sp.]
MATSSQFVCQTCGTVHGKWMGRCDGCGAWNTVVEEASSAAAPKSLRSRRKSAGKLDLQLLSAHTDAAPRFKTGLAEFDRVCGGGLVHGSTLLVAGDPGIGKSTLLLQVVAALAAGDGDGAKDSNTGSCVYISGEEALDQVRMRAVRLGHGKAPVLLASATNMRDILATLDAQEDVRLVVIDSIQTMFVDILESAPGTVSQVRASAQELIGLAKRRGITVAMVGHVTKEGLIAGPRVLEHMVDAVLYFEGERGHQFRILRATKNRFGPTDEIGVFEMSDAGLIEVANPSALFLAERRGNVAGAAVFAGLEGTRPLLVEIQALVSSSPLATPRRAVVGWDAGRLAMVLAVLEARCGLVLAGKEVYLNVVGGLRIGEPAADLAVAAALVSAATDRAVPPETVVFGEIGLSGEIRAVSQAAARLKEAAKLGFTRALAPPIPAGRGTGRSRGRDGGRAAGIEVREILHLQDLVGLFTEGQVRGPDRPPRGPAAGGEAKA